MLMAKYACGDMIKIHNGDTDIALIKGTHTLEDGESFPVKSITFDEDQIHVEVERPLSLVDAVGELIKILPAASHRTPEWNAVCEAYDRVIQGKQESK